MNITKIPIDELYDQLTLILQEEKYAKSTIQLYQEHVKRIKKFMLANNQLTILHRLQINITKKKLNQEITTIRRNVFSGQSFED